VCGIAGAVGGQAADPSVVERQLRTLEHRGPDSWGLHRADGATLGQARLAVIDLDGGDPPITDEDGSVGVSFNGEVYNFGELRSELEGAGHRLSTSGDTEVIAHLAETTDPVDLARRLDGMAAFAVWDARRRRLVLGRDRLGKKPLYYWSSGRELVFGSEIKALLAHPSVPRRLDTEAIPAYLGFGYTPTPATFFEGIRSVPPGHVLTFNDDAGPPRLDRYWEPQVPGAGDGTVVQADLDLEGAASATRLLLTQAVERRLVADVPLGAFLSGGVDSSAVVALMARAATGGQVRTFTIGFEDSSGFDEREFARTVAGHCGTDHTEFVVRPDAVVLAERLVWHHDQPFGDSSAIPTFLLAELTRAHVTVALCGDGGDEVFAGYERFAAALAAARWGRVPAGLRAAARAGMGVLPPSALAGRVRSVQRFLAGAELTTPDALRSWVASVPDDWREQLLPGSSRAGLDSFGAAWARSAGGARLPRLLDLTMRTYLLDDLLPKVDRMAMAHGLEVRSPFLDTELVELALRLPPNLQVRGFSRKRVLKHAVRDLLPPAILDRRKRGFGVPLDRWFRTDLAPFVADRLGGANASVRDHLSGASLDRLLAEHASGRANHGHALWALLTLELFLRREGW